MLFWCLIVELQILYLYKTRKEMKFKSLGKLMSYLQNKILRFIWKMSHVLAELNKDHVLNRGKQFYTDLHDAGTSQMHLHEANMTAVVDLKCV